MSLDFEEHDKQPFPSSTIYQHFDLLCFRQQHRNFQLVLLPGLGDSSATELGARQLFYLAIVQLLPA